MRDRHQRTHHNDTDACGHGLGGPGKMPGSHREADREPWSDRLPGVKETGRCTRISRMPPKSPERTDEPDGIDQPIRPEQANQERSEKLVSGKRVSVRVAHGGRRI